MIGCIISFIAGGFAGALVMALCAASKNSNVILDGTSENIAENKDVNMASGQGCNNCEPEHCKEDCCHNCNCSDGVFCDELGVYVTKGYNLLQLLRTKRMGGRRMNINIKALPGAEVIVNECGHKFRSVINSVEIEEDGSVTYMIYEEGSTSTSYGRVAADFTLLKKEER